MSNTPQIRFSGFTDVWEHHALGAHCEMYNGDRSSKYPGAQDMVSDGIPFVNAGDLIDGRVNLASANKITREKFNELGGAKLQIGDIVYCLRGTLGKNAYIDNFTEGTVASSLVAIRPQNIDGKYLFHVLNTEIEYRQRVLHDEGAAQPNLSAKNLSNFLIPVPIDEEQSKIATCLSRLNDLVVLHQCEYEKMVALKVACLDRMFPKKGNKVPQIRFAGFAKDWEQSKFKESFEFLTNNTLARAELDERNGLIYNLHYGDILVKFGETLNLERDILPYISDKTNVPKTDFLQNGDVIIADTAEDAAVGKCTEIIGASDSKIVSGLHTIPCRPYKKFAEGYLGYFMNSPVYHDQLVPLMQGTKVTSVSKSALQSTMIYYPSDIKEQTLIGEFFMGLNNLITLQEQKVKKLKQLKQAMLHNMFV